MSGTVHRLAGGTIIWSRVAIGTIGLPRVFGWRSSISFFGQRRHLAGTVPLEP
jgi:hypothetical protein